MEASPSYNTILRRVATLLGLPEGFRRSGFSRQPCKAKWRSHRREAP